MIFSHSACAASVLALCLVPCAARADDGQPTIIVTAERASDDARAQVLQRPGGVDVVDATDFSARVAVSLRDTLGFSPGVYLQPRFGQEVRISIRGSGISRGFHMRGLTLLQDGIPINLADDNGDFQELDPQVFERIEVYRGGNALRYGGSTLGGAVNAVTPTGRTAPRLELRADGGAFSTVRTKGAVAYADERGDAYLALTTDRSNGDRDHARRDSIRFNGNVAVRLSDDVETRFYATLNHIDQDLPGSLSQADTLDRPKRSLPANIAGDQERDIDSIRLQNRTTVRLDRGTVAFGIFFNAKQLIHPIFQVVDQKGVDRGAFASIDLAGEARGMPWELTIGTQARFGRVQAKQFVNVAGRRGVLTANVRQTARTINSYGELRLKPAAGLTLIAGGIYIAGERKGRNRLITARSGAADYEGFAPKIGLIFAVGGGAELYGNISRSIELPGFGEIFQTVGGLPTLIPVRTQKAWTTEIGTRGRRGIVGWDVSLYRAEMEDEMLQFTTAADIPAATFNAGNTRHQGIEAGLTLDLAPWARLRQTFSLNDFRFRRDVQYGDNRLPVVPRHQYRAELRLGAGAVSVTPNLEWVPQGAFVDYRNSFRARGYALIGIGAQARVGDGVGLFVDARNLTAKKAVGDISALVQYRRDDPTTTADEGSVAFYPVERRAVYGGLRVAF